MDEFTALARSAMTVRAAGIHIPSFLGWLYSSEYRLCASFSLALKPL